jgi:hypothetical protein
LNLFYGQKVSFYTLMKRGALITAEEKKNKNQQRELGSSTGALCTRFTLVSNEGNKKNINFQPPPSPSTVNKMKEKNQGTPFPPPIPQ